MRVFLSILLLIFSFQAFAKADDIRDFEIENMSLGDSLLKYFSENEIENNLSGAQYPNKEFLLYYFKGLSKFETYEAVTVAVKANDKDYIIYDLGGSIYFKDNFQDCLSMMKKIDNELNQMFTKAQNGSGKNSHAYDKSGKTIQHYSIYELETGDNSQIVCLNWSDELEKKGHVDELNLTIGFKEYGDFVRFRAYD